MMRRPCPDRTEWIDRQFVDIAVLTPGAFVSLLPRSGCLYGGMAPWIVVALSCWHLS